MYPDGLPPISLFKSFTLRIIYILKYLEEKFKLIFFFEKMFIQKLDTANYVILIAICTGIWSIKSAYKQS